MENPNHDTNLEKLVKQNQKKDKLKAEHKQGIGAMDEGDAFSNFK